MQGGKPKLSHLTADEFLAMLKAQCAIIEVLNGTSDVHLTDEQRDTLTDAVAVFGQHLYTEEYD